jgi:putative nucleotidyltransferase with HDIG domain
MHKVPVDQLTPRMQVGKTVYGTHGEVLLARGTSLGDEYIGQLKRRGFHNVWILDGIADDVEPAGLVSERLRAANVRNLQIMYDLMAEATQTIRDQAAEEGAHIVPELPLEVGEVVHHHLQLLDHDIEALLDEAIETKTLASLASLKSHDNYTFEHSVDVAFYGVVLGKKLAFDRPYLKDLALGCLLHDIGKMYVDERILRKPGRLTSKEFEQIKQHTVLGFQMLRQLPFGNTRPAHVALQHHERQDGSGYPGKRFGNNRIFRTQQEHFDLRRINLLAELGAVADVCSALSSDRPYRTALPTPEVVRLLNEMADSHLNREAVNAFMGVVQLYPVGITVRVSGGRFDECVGVVVAQSSRRRNRPVIRLLFDRNAHEIRNGCDLNLQSEPDTVELHSLPDIGISMAEHAQHLVRRRAA